MGIILQNNIVYTNGILDILYFKDKLLIFKVRNKVFLLFYLKGSILQLALYSFQGSDPHPCYSNVGI